MEKQSIMAIVFSVIILAGIAFFWYYMQHQNTSQTNILIKETALNNEDPFVAMQKLLAEKYNKQPSEIEVSIFNSSDDYLRGNYKIKSTEPSSASIFLASKNQGKWSLVFAGNPPAPCRAVSGLDFPAEMINDCLGE